MNKINLTLFVFLTMLLSSSAAAQNEFITEWLTTDGAITIPTSAAITMDGETAPYTYNYNIEWYNKRTGAQLGAETNITANFNINRLPTDTIVVKITGTFPHFYIMNNNSYKSKLIQVNQWGNIQWKNFAAAFYGCNNLRTVDAQSPNLSQVKNMSSMFSSATIFNADLSAWNVSNVTTMQAMFYSATAFNGNISTWNVSNVTNMQAMFYNTTAFNQDLSTWNVSNVTTMQSMFCKSNAFNQDLSTWNVSNVNDMARMFSQANAFNQDLSAWNVSNVRNMSEMFAFAVFNGNLSTWNVSNVTNMSQMFNSARAFNQDLSAWNVSNVTNMSQMFNGARAFNQDLSAWNVSNTRNMSEMFSGAIAFNQDLSTWNVSNVINMYRMFSGATAFNQDLSAWNIIYVNNIGNIFISTNMSYCNIDNILNAWAPILLNSTYPIGEVPAASINSATIRAALVNRISLASAEITNPVSTDFFIAIPDTICRGHNITLSASGANTYKWNGILGSSTNTFVINADTTLRVTGIQSNGCQKTVAIEITIDDCIGVDEVNNVAYTIYPNPTNDLVTITLENIDYTNASIALMDITGRILSTTTLENANTTISLANYPAGLYLIKVQSGNTFFVEKVNKL